MTRRDVPYGDNPKLAQAMPYEFEIGLLNHCLADQNVDGEAMDLLRPDLVAWLDANCAGQWRFVQSFSEPHLIIDPDSEEETWEQHQRMFLRFSDQNDAFACKMRWYGEPIPSR